MLAASPTTPLSLTQRLGVAMTACLIGLGACASATLAATSAVCPSAPVSTPFARFGDSADYSLVPGGSFESGAPGWSLTGATIVSGNESYEVDAGTQSLAIQPGGVALSPAVCVTTADPTFRFFMRRTSGSWGVLNVSLRWTDASGVTHNTTVASLPGATVWLPTPTLRLAGALPLWQPGSVLNVELVFSPAQYGGAWEIDDVYIDPRMS
jgi:hypothetical protein